MYISVVVRKMRIAIGGTFDPLHDGHKKLLKKAYELCEGGEIVIGVTSDKMARANKDRLVLYSYIARNVCHCVDDKRTEEKAWQESDKDSKSGTCKSSRWAGNLFYADKSRRDR